jgi:type II secretory pathway pseudopilin PulG
MQGFTLVETIMYLALFSIFLLGTLEGASSLQTSAEKNQTLAVIQSEGDFAVERISYEASNRLPLVLPAGNQIQVSDFALTTSTEMVGTSSIERLQVSFIASATSSNGQIFSEPFLFLTYILP